MILKLITFDITGTLLALRESVGDCYAKVGLLHGLKVSSEALSINFYCVFKKMLVEHPNFGESGIGWPEWWRQLVFRTFQDSSPQTTLVQSATVDKISSDLIEIYKTKQCWKLANGAQDLLDKLRSHNIQLGVISNYDPRLENILEDLNIRKYFKFVLTSYDAKCAKPDPAIFTAVEDMTMGLEKSEILHIGDNPRLDFLGAKGVGWNALLIAEDFAKMSETFSDIEEEWVVKNVSKIYPTLRYKNLL